jgi:hypothetical protein
MADPFLEGLQEGTQIRAIFQGIPQAKEREQLNQLQLINQLRRSLNPIQAQEAQVGLDELLAGVPVRGQKRQLESTQIQEQLDPAYREQLRTAEEARRAAQLIEDQNRATIGTTQQPGLAERTQQEIEFANQRRGVESQALTQKQKQFLTDEEIERQRQLKESQDLNDLGMLNLNQEFLSSLSPEQRALAAKKKLGIPDSPEEIARQKGLIAEAEASGKAKGEGTSKITPANVTFDTNVKAFTKHADDLEKIVMSFGNYEGGSPISNPDATAALPALAYSMAIEYAKLKDPESVAREGEVAAAQKYLIPTGLMTRNSVTLAAIKRQRKDIEELKKLRVESGGKFAPPEGNSQGSLKLKSGATVEIIP